MQHRIFMATALAVALCHPALAAADENAFNPAFSPILSGTYGNLQRDPAIPATGFATNPNPGHEQGFNIGESEMGISANIDPQFRGVATLALDPAGGISVENAFVQTTTLGKPRTGARSSHSRSWRHMSSTSPKIANDSRAIGLTDVWIY